MNEIGYQTGSPTKTGVYACRVPDDYMGYPFCKDIFLLWHQNAWWYLMSAEQFRGNVPWWIGPLPRPRQNDL